MEFVTFIGKQVNPSAVVYLTVVVVVVSCERTVDVV